MKNLFIVLVVFLMTTGITAQEKNSEKEAIKKVISEATEAYRAKNFNKIATAYVHDNSLIKTTASLQGHSEVYGWKEVSENYKNFFKNNPDPVTGKYEKVNFKIKVYGESAWSIHDEVFTDPEGMTSKQVITHFLEKHDGQWKIVYMANIRALTWDVQ